MRDRFTTFALHFGKRRSKKQKNRFIMMLLDVMEPLGYLLKMQQFKFSGREGRNIIVGNLEQAKLIYMVDYDTKERIINDHYRYYPFDENFNLKVLRANYLKYMVTACLLLAFGTLSFFLGRNRQDWVSYLFYGLSVTGAIGSFIFAKALGSPYNFKKTASAFMLCELAKQRNKECCYVFLDHSLFIGAGQYEFFQEYDLKGKTVVYIDNAAIGTLTVVQTSKNTNKEFLHYLQKKKELFEVRITPMEIAENNDFTFLYITLCEKDESNLYYIDHISTKTDSEFKEEDYQNLINVLLEIQTEIL